MRAGKAGAPCELGQGSTMNIQQRARPFLHDFLKHPLLSFLTPLPHRDFYIKQVLLVPFLTRSLRNETCLMTFISYVWCRILGFRVIIFKELVIQFLSTVRFNWDTRIWSDDLTLSFRLGGVARSCSLLELGKLLEIYSAKDIDHLFLETFLDSCNLSEPREYNYMSVWPLAVREYMVRSVKERNFRSPLHLFMHRLIISTIHHREEQHKVPSDDLFPMWCLLHIDVHLHIPYAISYFLSSSLTLGSRPRSKIYGGHFICHLARSYRVDTYGITHYPLRELDGRI
ncbi:unnamed protein product [Lactuca saligna]|uniref:Uncharacterized protein n=1 Tax=Lactuca saligna TaxID=75948 RepID=A0AA35VB16_LACSI|nr:unnamed protein product [Lactuca saligna]